MLKIIKGSKLKKEIERIKKNTAFGADKEIIRTVEKIILDVKKYGDKALLKYTEKYDGIKLTKKNLEIKEFEIELAHVQTDEDVIKAIRTAIKNISRYHLKGVPKSWVIPVDVDDGSKIGLRYSPLNKVGVYVPGGRAQYPSSVLMNVVPAKIAGVEEVIMTVPPAPNKSINHVVLAAAFEVGVHRIFKVGGAQAVAALAYGTETIPRVDKIVGPGSIYVALAKKIVYGDVGIDKLAGPSDICIVADKNAPSSCISSDLLSQLEHDPLASAILVTNSESIARKVNIEIRKQIKNLINKKIILKSMNNNSIICLVKDMKEAADCVNRIAPEHLEIMTEKPYNLMGKIDNVGAVFIGKYSPEPLGDYIAGPNHVLPTGGTSRFSSPLGVDDFIKKSSIIHFTKKGLKHFKDEIILFAELEGLDAHANSIRKRF